MRVVVTSEPTETVEDLRRAAKGLGVECSPNDCVSYENLPVRLSQSPPPDFIVVTSGKDPNRALPAVQYAAQHAGCPVLAAGPGPLGAAVLMDGGARLWIDRGRAREELQEALEQMEADGALKIRRGRLLAVVSAHSGVGATTVSSNLAFVYSSGAQPGDVLLAEMGADVPRVALDLDLTPTHGLADLFANWERSDAYMVKGVAVPHPGGPHFLVHAPETLVVPPVEGNALKHLSVLTRTMYRHVIFDLGPGVRPEAADTLALADAVVVVFLPEVASVRLTRAYLRHLKEAGVPAERIALVANRTGWREQLDRASVEQTLGRPVTEWLPDEPRTFMTAVNAGKPPVEIKGRTGFIKKLERLAQLLSPKQ